MIVYLTMWFVAFALLGAVVSRALPCRLAAVIAVLVFGFFAVVRGGVGTDTVGVYESMAHGFLLKGAGQSDIEPGFRYLLYGSVLWTQSARFAVRAIALIFTAFLLLFATRSNKVESWYLLALFIPANFIELSFNAERVGIASVILLLSLQQYRLRRTKLSAVLFWGSLLFHYSILLVMAYTLLVEKKLRTKRFLIVSFVMFGCVAAFMYFARFYIHQKMVLYVLSGYSAPGALSGLSQISIVAIILAGLDYFKLDRQIKRRMIMVSIAFCVMSWMAARYSYAGLRLLDLVAFALPYALIRAIARGDAILTSRGKATLALAGFVGAAFFFRNILLEPATSLSPFVPYRFIWK